jgi:hypothetical protein
VVEEKRVRVVFESVGGAAAADDASRFTQALGGVEAAEQQTGESTAALRAEIERLQQQVAGLQQAQQRGQQQQQSFAAAQLQAANNAIQLTQRIQAAASAIGSMATALGSEGTGRAAGLLGAMTASAAAGAQLGMTFGPQGALVGGILGAAIPALTALTEQHDAAAEAAARQREEVDRLRQSLLAQRLEGDIEGALADPSMAPAILGSLPDDTIRQQRDIAALRAREEDQAAAALRRRAAQGEALSDEEIAQAQGAGLRAAQQRLALLDAEAERRRALAQATRDQADAERLRAAGAEEQERERHARERQHSAERREISETEALSAEAAAKRYEDAWVAAEERRMAAASEAYDQWKELQEQQTAAYLENLARQQAANEEHQREFASSSLAQLQREQRDRTAQLDRETEQRQQQLQGFADIAGGVSRSLVTAVAEVTSGAKTAEEAFKGMLSSFLMSIAEQALISAMREYAEAIASFARYDFGAGAGHVAAGLAFTGVAVATGAAAGAVSAPSAPSQQADRPDRVGGDQGNGGRVVNIVNWNAPVAVAGSEAEAGRMIGRLGDRAAGRFGRLAA